MAIEELPNGAIVVTGDDTRTAALVTLAHAITMEMTTDLRMSSRVSLLQVARNHGVVPDDGTRPHKKKLLKLTLAKIKESWPEYAPSEKMKGLIK